MVTIESVRNGYIVRHAMEDCEGKPMESVDVFEQGDAGCKCCALASALWATIDALGIVGSKHDACRIRVSCKCEEDG